MTSPLKRPRRALLLAAALLALPVLAQAEPAVLPLTAGDAPSVAGITLGQPLAQVQAVLGAPDPSLVPEDQNAEVRSLSYRDGALLLLVSKADGVARIMLNRPEAGAVAGLRAGDSIEPMLAAWGAPSASNATTGLYRMGAWYVAVRVDPATRRIQRLMLALSGAVAQPIDLPPPAWATQPSGADRPDKAAVP